MTLEQVIADVIRRHLEAEYGECDPDKIAAHIVRIIKAVQGL